MSTRIERPRGIESTDNAVTVRHMPMAANFSAPAGTAVKLSSGYVTPVTTNSDPVFGITAENGENGATAGAGRVPIHVGKETVFRASASAGEFGQADRGKVCDIAATGRTLLRTAATRKNFEVIDVRGSVAFVRLVPTYTDAS